MTAQVEVPGDLQPLVFDPHRCIREKTERRPVGEADRAAILQTHELATRLDGGGSPRKDEGLARDKSIPPIPIGRVVGNRGSVVDIDRADIVRTEIAALGDDEASLIDGDVARVGRDGARRQIARTRLENVGDAVRHLVGIQCRPGDVNGNLQYARLGRTVVNRATQGDPCAQAHKGRNPRSTTANIWLAQHSNLLLILYSSIIPLYP